MAFTQISTDGIKNGTITGSDLATNIDLTDSQKIRFGNSQDLQLFHDGNNSVITAGGAGDLQLISTFDDVIIQAADNIFINPQGGENGLKVYGDGAVKLYYDNAQKFETTSDGVKILGGEGIEAILTFEPDEGDNASDKFRFRASDSAGFFLENGSSNDTSIKANFNGSIELYHGGTKKFETTSGGVKVSGTNLNMNSTYIDFSGSISTPSTAAAIYRPADNTLAFSTANTERVRITNGGLDPSTDGVTDLGNSGDRFRHLNLSGRILMGGATSVNASTNADDLQIGASGQANQTGISLGSAVASSIRFMDVADDSAGSIFYNHGTDDMAIEATNSITLSEAGTVRFSTHSNGVIISGFTDGRQDSTSAYSSSASPGNVLARFYNGSAQDNSHAAIQLRASNDNAAADIWWMSCVAQSQNYNGFLAFTCRTSASVSQEVARMTNGRAFLVGTTSTLNLGANNVTGIVLENNGRITAARNGSAALHVGRQGDNGEAVLFACQGTSIVGSINVTTTSTTLQSGSSDRTMKKNFEDWTEDTLSLFKNLKPQKFNFIIEDDGAEKTKGYIAQDLVDSFPEAYPKNSEGKYMFSPQGMVVYLMKAIQELEAEVAALKAA
tara:strand:+ start:1940 stop:3781 length:1842 start_codon:yes stop_codon:yes gene_type:complete